MIARKNDWTPGRAWSPSQVWAAAQRAGRPQGDPQRIADQYMATGELPPDVLAIIRTWPPSPPMETFRAMRANPVVGPLPISGRKPKRDDFMGFMLDKDGKEIYVRARLTGEGWWVEILQPREKARSWVQLTEPVLRSTPPSMPGARPIFNPGCPPGQILDPVSAECVEPLFNPRRRYRSARGSRTGSAFVVIDSADGSVVFRKPYRLGDASASREADRRARGGQIVHSRPFYSFWDLSGELKVGDKVPADHVESLRRRDESWRKLYTSGATDLTMGAGTRPSENPQVTYTTPDEASARILQAAIIRELRGGYTTFYYGGNTVISGFPKRAILAVARSLGIRVEAAPAQNAPRTRAGAEKLLDKQIEQAYYRHAYGVQVPIMDIPKIFRDIKLELAGGVDIDTATISVVNRYRAGGEFAKNPILSTGTSFAEAYKLADPVRDWWIAPAKRESYTGRFQGTFAQAVERAAEASAFWKSKVQVHTDMTMLPIGPQGQRPAPIDYMGPLWATVSVPESSPLRGGPQTRPLSGTYSNPAVQGHNPEAQALIARMTVGAPNPPAYFVIDPQTKVILSIRRATKSMDLAFREAVSVAKGAAAQLGYAVYVVVHPYIPSGFKPGQEVSPLFYHYGAQAVYPDGRMGPANNPLLPPFGIPPNPVSRQAQDYISSEISALIRKGMPQRQAIAAAYSMARRAGFRVPPPNPLQPEEARRILTAADKHEKDPQYLQGMHDTVRSMQGPLAQTMALHLRDHLGRRRHGAQWFRAVPNPADLGSSRRPRNWQEAIFIKVEQAIERMEDPRPMLQQTYTREQLISALQWNDPNGVYDDEGAQREGFPVLTSETAAELIFQQSLENAVDFKVAAEWRKAHPEYPIANPSQLSLLENPGAGPDDPRWLYKGRKEIDPANKRLIQRFMMSVNIGVSDAEVESIIRAQITRKSQPPEWLIQKAIKYALAQHHYGQQDYSWMMGGLKGPGPRRPRNPEEEHPTTHDVPHNSEYCNKCAHEAYCEVCRAQFRAGWSTPPTARNPHMRCNPASCKNPRHGHVLPNPLLQTFLLANPGNPYRQSEKDFIWFLTNTLIPDLIESGYEETAKDFTTGLDHLYGGKPGGLEFAAWLRGTLIPDLKESGREFTASDLTRLAGMIEKKFSRGRRVNPLTKAETKEVHQRIFDAEDRAREYKAAGQRDQFQYASGRAREAQEIAEAYGKPGVWTVRKNNPRRPVARWEARGGKRWIELYQDAYGYGYNADNGGGNLGAFPNDQAAIARMEHPQYGAAAALISDFSSTRRVFNPLTVAEGREISEVALAEALTARRMKPGEMRGFHAGRADGMADVARKYGPEFVRTAAPNPHLDAPPWKEGQKVPVAEARAWVVSTGDKELLRQFDEAAALQKKANRTPKHVVWQMLAIGSPRRVDAVTAMVQYGESPETIYKPPPGSKKGSSLYRHEWGEGSGKEKPVPVLAAASGKAIVMPLRPGQTVGDWMRG